MEYRENTSKSLLKQSQNSSSIKFQNQIILLGIGWIILSRILWNSPFYAPLVGILVGSLAGLFLGRGKLKLFIPKLEKT